MTPYYDDGLVQLWHGDCRQITAWLAADVLLIDPPYGVGYDRRRGTFAIPDARPVAIAGDRDTALRDEALALWGNRPGIVFGDLDLAPPGKVQTLVYRKPPESGTHGTHGGFRHDLEGIYLTGRWPAGLGGRSSLIETTCRAVSGSHGLAARTGHPHAKPPDVIEQLLAACPAGTVADPFAGCGPVLIAARLSGRRCIAVEIEERYCEQAALRLAQLPLPLIAAPPPRPAWEAGELPWDRPDADVTGDIRAIGNLPSGLGEEETG